MMWTMGYNDGVESVNNIPDPSSCSSRKLRQLVPRPNTAHDHLLALNRYHLETAMAAEQNRRELIGTRQVVASSRWNPTPDQLHILEELYRRGTRTPSADQIQQITAQLRRYGKVEGKNVFYWFQNHKARERQKRRRQLENGEREQQPHYNINADENGQSRDSAVANRTPHEVEQTMNWTKESGTTADQETLSRQETTKAVIYKAADHGCTQYFDETNDAELLQQRRNAMWHTMHLSCSSSDPTNLIISCSSAATVKTNSTTIPPTVLSSSVEIMNGLLKPQESIIYNISSQCSDDDHHGAAQTLQLFPVRSNIHEKCVNEDEEPGSAMLSITTSSTAAASNYQFFEFLPIKNC